MSVVNRFRTFMHSRELRSFVRSLDEDQGVLAFKSDGMVYAYIVRNIKANTENTTERFYADNEKYFRLTSQMKLEVDAEISRPPWIEVKQ